MSRADAFETIELGNGIVEVRFLRGVSGGANGWWCIRTGKDFNYHDISFIEYVAGARDKERALPGWTPGAREAAGAMHLSFCDATGEGLSIPEATRENVTLLDRYGTDGLLYRVTVRRTVTQRVAKGAVH